MNKILAGLLLISAGYVFGAPDSGELDKLQWSLENEYKISEGTIHQNSDFIYLFSNEWSIKRVPFGYFSRAISEINQLELIPDRKLTVAVLIGHSSIHALLKALEKHVDMVITADFSSAQLDYQRIFITAFLKSSVCGYEWLVPLSTSEEAFIDYIVSKRGYNRDDFLKEYYDDKRKQGRYHPFYSTENYLDQHRAACHLRFSFIAMNLSVPESVQQLGEILQKHEASVRVFNASNAYEWIAMKRADNNLTDIYPVNWPLKRDMLFIYSRLYSLFPQVSSVLIKNDRDKISSFERSAFSVLTLYFSVAYKELAFRILAMVLYFKSLIY